MSKRPFAVFDIDGTIFRSSLFIEVLEECIRKGLFADELHGRIAAAKRHWLERDSSHAYEDYLGELVEIFNTNIKGVKRSHLALVAESIVDRMHRYTYVYTRDLVEKLKNSHFLIAISGSPYEVVAKFAEKYGFDTFVATVYHDTDGVLTGETTKANTRKGRLLTNIVEQYGLPMKGSLAVGDSHGDRELMEIVENPVAFNPDRELFDLSVANGWNIVVERKNVVFHLEKIGKTYRLRTDP
jgi:HAD superfamily hydrolase (TIGR01490 family)